MVEKCLGKQMRWSSVDSKLILALQLGMDYLQRVHLILKRKKPKIVRVSFDLLIDNEN